MIGTDGFQECDTVGITRSVTKHNELIMDPEEIPLLVRQAFHLATTGRPGPVLLDVPKDVLTAEVDVVVAERRGCHRLPARLPAHAQGPSRG